jgi:hypothetical protein
VTVESAIRGHLLATAAVTALAGTRVYVLKAPQKPGAPYVRVMLVSDIGETHLRGAHQMRRSRVQIDIGGTEGETTYGVIDALASAVDAALMGEPFTDPGSPPSLRVVAVSVDRRTFYDAEELRLLRFIQDYIVWSQPV